MRKTTYKDMEKYRKTKRKQKRRYYGKTKNAPNKWRRWTLKDIDMILEHKLTDAEISALIGRSVASIQRKRSDMKKMGSKKGQ